MAAVMETSPTPGEIRTWVDFVVHVENTLGWLPDPRYPVWKSRAIEASKIKRKIAEDPKLYTRENLILTVGWLRRRRQGVRSPVGVCWYVKQALEDAPVDEPLEEIEDKIHAAIAAEIVRPRPDSQWWIDRLYRVRGAARAEVYAEYLETRR